MGSLRQEPPTSAHFSHRSVAHAGVRDGHGVPGGQHHPRPFEAKPEFPPMNPPDNHPHHQQPLHPLPALSHQGPGNNLAAFPYQRQLRNTASPVDNEASRSVQAGHAQVAHSYQPQQPRAEQHAGAVVPQPPPYDAYPANVQTSQVGEVPTSRTSAANASPPGLQAIQEALRAFSPGGGAATADRADYAAMYGQLIGLYESKCDALYEAVNAACHDLVVESRVPEIPLASLYGLDDVDGEKGDSSNMQRLGGVGDPADERSTAEDVELQREVKRTFVEAMEILQNTSVPKKRRGNLPKEATATFRRWFQEHYDHPYPTEEEKRALSRETGTGVAQITNWFINHRKRVWKPNLPQGHPGRTSGPDQRHDPSRST